MVIDKNIRITAKKIIKERILAGYQKKDIIKSLTHKGIKLSSSQYLTIMNESIEEMMNISKDNDGGKF